MRGTPLERVVWRRLLDIPYGKTESYGELAARVDPEPLPHRLRAVAAGPRGRRRERAQPGSIIVPCHRVIGADGSLTGYGGGLHRKQALLELERPVNGRCSEV